MSRHSELGRLGENKAAEFLTANGYTIIHRNYRAGRAEIDIIATIDRFIVFVEVKTRTNYMYGAPEESVTSKKQKLLMKAAGFYLCENNVEKELRFDIITVFQSGDDNWTLTHMEDAFFIYD